MPLLPSAAWQAAQTVAATCLPFSTSALGDAETAPAAKTKANKVNRFMECS